MIAVAYGARTYNRNFDWENDVRLWTQAAQVCPDSFKTHKSLAYALYERDSQKNPPSFPDIDRIIEEGEKARDVIEEEPLPALYRASIVYLHLGAYYQIKGDILAQHGPDSARPWYEKSVETLNTAVVSDRAFNEDNHRKELARGRAPDQIPDIGNHQIYLNLGLVYLRLGQYQNALNALLAMRHLVPTDIDAYLNIASAHLSAGHTEQAAISLVQALLFDSNRKDVLQRLLDIYRQIDREGCAIIMSEGLPRLNADCAIVGHHLCSAYDGLVQVFTEAKLFDLAQRMKQTALEKYHCPPEPLQQPTQNN